jgi:hypothetical protein
MGGSRSRHGWFRAAVIDSCLGVLDRRTNSEISSGCSLVGPLMDPGIVSFKCGGHVVAGPNVKLRVQFPIFTYMTQFSCRVQG